MPPISPFLACRRARDRRVRRSAASAATAAAARRTPAGAVSFGASAAASLLNASTDALTSAGTSVAAATSFDELRQAGVERRQLRRDLGRCVCSSCISIAMSNSFLRSTSVSTTSGSAHDAQRLGLDRLAVDDQRDVVDAGEHVRTGIAATAAAESAAAATAAATAAGAERTRRLLVAGRRARRPARLPCRRPGAPRLRRRPRPPPAGRRRHRLHAQIPARRLDARLAAVRQHRPADLAHLAAGRVGDLQRDARRPASSAATRSPPPAAGSRRRTSGRPRTRSCDRAPAAGTSRTAAA